MGVMACSVSNCTEIMCDTYIEDFGYMCSDCKERFKDYILRQPDNKYFDSSAYLVDKLKEFKEIPVSSANKEKVILAVEEFLKSKSIK